MIVFDLDGTLVDSRREIARALEAAWSSTLGGLAFPRERLRVGPPLPSMIRALDPSLSDAQRAAVAAAFCAIYDASDFAETRPYPGIPEALDALAARGASLSVATNKRRAPTEKIVARWLPGRFAHVLCSDDPHAPAGDAAAWDKAQMLRWLSASRDRASSALVMVGDAVSDIAAARAAGARAVAVAWGYDPVSALLAAGPDATARDVDALVAALSHDA